MRYLASILFCAGLFLLLASVSLLIPAIWIGPSFAALALKAGATGFIVIVLAEFLFMLTRDC